VTSIYEHVRAGSTELPDEEDFRLGSGIRFAPGAREGVLTRYWAGEEEGSVEDAVAELHAALVRLADRPGRRTRKRARELLRRADARSYADPLVARLESFLPRNPDRLHDELRRIFLESDHREEVKLAAVVLGPFGRAEDAELFRTIGRHAEFTLYAAVALAHAVPDPLPEWRELLRHVSGWGKTELASLMLRDPTPEVRDVLLRDGHGVGNALELAVGCRLREALEVDEPDDELVRGAGDIIHSLAFPTDSPDDLTLYSEAGPAVERYLELLEPRAHSYEDFVRVDDIRLFLDDPSWSGRLEGCGFDEDRQRRVREACARILARPEWRSRVESALADGTAARWPELNVAKRLGIDVGEYAAASLEADPSAAGMWSELVTRADRAGMQRAIDLAVRLLDLEHIRAAEHMPLFGVGPEAEAVDAIVQRLEEFPGLGREILGPALRSPIPRHRYAAVRALGRWEPAEVPSDLRSALKAVARGDPEDELRAFAAALLSGPG
jgi:hypothetical protein